MANYEKLLHFTFASPLEHKVSEFINQHPIPPISSEKFVIMNWHFYKQALSEYNGMQSRRL